MSDQTALAVHTDLAPLTAADIKSQRDMIVKVMRDAMKKDIDYGLIPGCGDKPTMFKPGSEKILSMFHIAIEPVVEDLSDEDCARYRVLTRAISASGRFLGTGVGEASSDEEKYKWRKAVSTEEYEAFEERGRARIKFAKGQGGTSYTVPQVRTNPADVANTVLKMAKKRSQIDLTLTVTAASDVFSQDLEDLPEEIRDSVNGNDTPGQGELPLDRGPQRASKTGAAPAAPSTPGEKIVTEAQAKLFWRTWKFEGKRDPEDVKRYLKEVCGVDNDRKMPERFFNAALAWASGRTDM